MLKCERLGIDPSKRLFLSVESAAEYAGYTIRQFRRIMAEDGIQIMWIGRRAFVKTSDVDFWLANKPNRRR